MDSIGLDSQFVFMTAVGHVPVHIGHTMQGLLRWIKKVHNILSHLVGITEMFMVNGQTNNFHIFSNCINRHMTDGLMRLIRRIGMQWFHSNSFTMVNYRISTQWGP